MEKVVEIRYRCARCDNVESVSYTCFVSILAGGVISLLTNTYDPRLSDGNDDDYILLTCSKCIEERLSS